MTDTARLVSSTDADEGFVSSAYPDSRGIWSAGKGRCLETNPITGSEWRYLLENKLVSLTITEEGANWLRDRDLKTAEDHLRARYAWFASLDDARQNAFIEMCFQLGSWKFDAFHRMLIAAAAGDWSRVHGEALDSDWARQTPKRAKALALQLLFGEFAQT